MFGRKDKENISEFDKCLEEMNVKDGFIKVYRIKKNANGRQIGSRPFFIKNVPLRNLQKKSIESYLSDNFGGGEFEIELYRRNENSSESLVETFYFPIDGPIVYDEDAPETTKESAYEKLMLKMLEKQLDTGGDSETKELLRAVLSQNSGNSLLNQIQTLKEIQSVLAPPAVPNISPENETTALINLAGKIVPALLTKGGNVNPSEIQKLTNMAELPLPNNQTQITAPIQNNIETGNNGNKPQQVTIQRAFEIMYLERFKNEIAMSSNDTENPLSPEDIAGMIESMTISSIFWLQPAEYHPVLTEFIDGFQKVDLGKLKSGFDKIIQYAAIDSELAARVQIILINLYQNRLMTDDKNKGVTDESTESTESE